jgi:hypothetical protein
MAAIAINSVSKTTEYEKNAFLVCITTAVLVNELVQPLCVFGRVGGGQKRSICIGKHYTSTIGCQGCAAKTLENQFYFGNFPFFGKK